MTGYDQAVLIVIGMLLATILVLGGFLAGMMWEGWNRGKDVVEIHIPDSPEPIVPLTDLVKKSGSHLKV